MGNMLGQTYSRRKKRGGRGRKGGRGKGRREGEREEGSLSQENNREASNLPQTLTQPLREGCDVSEMYNVVIRRT